MPETAPLRLDVTVGEVQSRDTLLSDAVNRLIPRALENRNGILITQHDYTRYTIEVHPCVPWETIQEKRLS